MKTFNLTRLAVAAGFIFMGAAGSAQADLGDNFDVNGAAGGLGGGLLTNIDSINFRYSAIIDQQQNGPTFLDGDDHFNESGFMSFSAFQDDNGIAMLGSGLNNTYKMYAVFEADGTAGLNPAGIIEAKFTSFHLQFYIDDVGNTTFSIPANGTGFTTTGNNADDKLLAKADIIDAGQSHISPASLANGDFKVVMTDFGLQMFGPSFFTNPNPFYQQFFFTGVTTKITLNSGSVTGPSFNGSATGSGDLAFKATTVPEPSSIVLFGAGLLGLGLGSKRRNQK